MTTTACIRFAPLYSVERQPPEWCRSGRKLYSRGGLKFLPGRDTVPLLVDHDPDKEIGRVHQLVEWDDLGGAWLVARADVYADPPAWLGRGTGASFGSKLHNRSTFIDGWIYDAYVVEVTVCSPSHVPKEPGAQVVLLERSAPAAVPQPKPEPRRVIHNARPPATRRPTVREWLNTIPADVDAATFERLMVAAQETPLDGAYREWQESRAPEPQILRHNAGGRVARDQVTTPRDKVLDVRR